MTIRSTREAWALSVFIALFFVLQAALSLRHNLNWDEYFFLSHVYAFVDGRLTEPFQTFHVHLLAWLTMIPGTEADHLVAGRLFMMLCEAGSLFCLYRIAREFVAREDALFALAAWCAAGEALVQGASFRADPLAGFLMMAALAVLMCSRRTWLECVLAGLLAAIGLLVTIKSAFFLPAFVGALHCRWRRDDDKGVILRQFSLAAMTVLAAYALLWVLHARSLAPLLPPTAEPVTASPLGAERAALQKVILSQALFPRADVIVRWALASPLPVLLCALGLWRAARQPGGLRVTLLLFAAPILALVIYRNAFPYFMPFVMLPVALCVGVGVAALNGKLLRLSVLAAMAIWCLSAVPEAWRHDQSAQRAVARTARQLFPVPVHYIDGYSMLPSFAEDGFFMSTWGLEEYMAARKSVLADAIARDQPPLLILNSPALRHAISPQNEPLRWRLLSSDVEALRDNYIEEWGPVWVAGKTMGQPSGRFDIVIGGTYTLECQGIRQIDRTDGPCGGTVYLAPGPHTWSGGAATLRWGDHLRAPNEPPPGEPIFYGF